VKKKKNKIAADVEAATPRATRLNIASDLKKSSNSTAADRITEKIIVKKPKGKLNKISNKNPNRIFSQYTFPIAIKKITPASKTVQPKESPKRRNSINAKNLINKLDITQVFKINRKAKHDFFKRIGRFFIYLFHLAYYKLGARIG